MSKSKVGKNNPNFGKKFSKETRRKLSKAKSGKNHPLYNPNIYKFINIKTGEIVETTCYDLRKRYGCHHCLKLISGTRKSSKSWSLFTDD